MSAISIADLKKVSTSAVVLTATQVCVSGRCERKQTYTRGTKRNAELSSGNQTDVDAR